MTIQIGSTKNNPQIVSSHFQQKKEFLKNYFDSVAAERDKWIAKNSYYHESIEQICRDLIRPDSAVLVVGSGTGTLLPGIAANPATSIGVDISPAMVKKAQEKFPLYRFVAGDAENLELEGTPKFDYIVLADVVGYLEDIEACLKSLQRFCHLQTRLVITYYNLLWEPVLQFGEKVGLKMPQEIQNWLSMNDIRNILYLSDYEVEVGKSALLLPKKIPVVSTLLNKVAPNVPLLKELCLVQYFSARFRPLSEQQIQNRQEMTCSVIVPCRNEEGNIQDGVERIPEMGKHTEIIFVDGNSSDGTVTKIEEMIKLYEGKKDIRLIHQVPARSAEATGEQEQPNRMLKLGKGDAVRKGFDAAKGDVLMILDADLTVAPEDLPKFFDPLVEGKAQFINGCRLVYPLEDEAMRFVNLCGNKAFSLLFSWLLGQTIKDTLCGTKVMFKKDYEELKINRAYFGEFDPFGDFDLLFGAARLKYRIVDMPIRYRRRVAGASKVSVIKHGILLVRMTWIGFQKFKLNKWFGRG